MPMDSLLFVVNVEMNIPFGKFLARYNYVGVGICVQSGGIIWIFTPLNFIM